MTVASPQRPRVFNIPNQLTTARLGLAILLFWLISAGWWVWCIVVFAIAAVTDWLDGYIARRQGLSSTLGRVFDPLVDKVLVGGAYIFLLPVPGSGLFAWIVTLVIAREMIITGMRSFMESTGVAFGADWLGKLKMGLQCAALFAIFVALLVQEPDHAASTVAVFNGIRDVLIYAMVAATALSGLQYLWRAALIFRAERRL